MPSNKPPRALIADDERLMREQLKGRLAQVWPELEIVAEAVNGAEAIARAAGLRCTIGSNLELGIGTAAMLHIAAAFPEVDTDTFPADTIGPFYHEADLITEPLKLGPPAAKVPEGPGLGVELDEAQLERWRVR